MKHAVLIMAHNNMAVVKTLMRMLDDSRFTFYLEVDKKSKFSPEDFIPELKNSACRVLERQNVNWGGYSMIEAELRLIDEALSDGQEYLHFVQGADLPLKTANQIDTICDLNEIMIDVQSEPNLWVTYKVLCKHFLVDRKTYRNNRFLKTIDHSIAYLQKPFIKRHRLYRKLYTGSALWSIPRDFAQYLLEQEVLIKKLYKHSLACDEVFIHTVCMNSEFKNRISKSGNCRLINWEEREGNSPKTYTIDDMDAINQAISAENLLFVRKIAYDRDPEIVDYIVENVK